MKKCVAIAVAAGASTVALAGSENLIVNGSFENSWDVPTGIGYLTVYADDAAINGWDITRGSVDLVGWWPGGDLGEWAEWFWESPDGSTSLDLAGLSSGAVSQTINTEAGRDYLLEFQIGGNWGGDDVVKQLDVVIDGEATRFEFDITGSGRGVMGWRGESLQFRALGPTTTIEFGDIGNVFFGAAIDDVSVTLVPAPGAAAIGLLGLGAAARRRRTR